MMPTHDNLKNAYKDVKNACKKDWMSSLAGDTILNLVILSMKFLELQCECIDLISKVPDKQYMTYMRNDITARPANSKFFMKDTKKVSTLWKKWKKNNLKPDELAAMSYTVALAPCLAMELINRQNKKSPATYFECLIGHIFARTLKIEPMKRVSLPIKGENVMMTMDFLFELGGEKSNLHLPVKMSTRERVVQAWAHQKLLDSAYGEGVYKGILVVFSETKLDSQTKEVVEICVPDQWLAYQTLLARFDKIYYFDMPQRYQALTDMHPEIIEIRPFGEFFNQIESVVN